MNQKIIAIIDPSSRGLPYDFYFIKEVSKRYVVHFYYSKSEYNYEYIHKLKALKNVFLFEYFISSVNNIKAIYQYFLMLSKIFLNKHKYERIHFLWSIFFPLEIVFFIIFEKKLIFTFHNDKPHEINKKTYFPYKIIYYLSKKIVFVSSFTKDRFINNYYVDCNKCLCLPHGVLPINEKINLDYNDEKKVDRTIVFWGLVKPYKGVDIFIKLVSYNFFFTYNLEIIGKWSVSLLPLKYQLQKKRIKIIDKYLSLDELKVLMERNVVFILPYKDATQSGIAYTLLYYEKIFISSDIGETATMLKKAGLENLVFNINDLNSLECSLSYIENNYEIIINKIKYLKNSYLWENVLDKNKLKELYEE